jgi:hypothetical protein
MRPQDMIRELPGPPVDEWIARLPEGTHAERRAWLREQGLSSNHRLADAGSFGSGSITHRVALAAVEDVDAELEGWLRAAYEARG